MARLAIVSTFPPARCGIGNYTSELVRALATQAPALDVTVVAERVPGEADTPGVIRAWQRGRGWPSEALAAIDHVRPDVVHIQHEESIFGNRRVLPFLRELRARGIRTVMTLHTVHDHWFHAGFHRSLARACDVLVVHQREGMANVLRAHGAADSAVEVIAHGTPAFELPEQSAARDALGLPASPVPLALFFGFIHYGKGLHVAVEAFERSHARFPDAQLVIAGQVRMNHIIDRLYAARLRRRMAAGIAAGRIVYRPGFVSVDDKLRYLAAASVLVLPHNQAYGSASGVLHEGIAAGRPILCTRGKKFAEAVEEFAEAAPELFPAPGDIAAWQRGFEALLPDRARRDAVGNLIASLQGSTSWTSSAARHHAVYERLLGSGLAALPARTLEGALEPAEVAVGAGHLDSPDDRHRDSAGALRDRK